MRILLASSSSGSKGGGEIFLVYLGRELAVRGHMVAVWSSSHPRMDMLAESCRAFAEVIRQPYRNTYDRRGRGVSAMWDQAMARQLADRWRAWRPDVLHLNKQNLEDGAELLSAARLCPDIPSLCTIHITQSAAFLGAKSAWLRDVAARSMLRRYPGLLAAVGPRRLEALRQFLKAVPSRCRMVVNGVPVPSAESLAEKREHKRSELALAGRVCVLAAGRMTAQKRPLLFLDLAHDLHRRHPEMRFIWVGDGDLAGAWDARVKEAGLQGTVCRVPWVEDPSAWYAAADVLLHTAEFEGLPLAVLEAMGSGLPCVMADDIIAEGRLEEEAGVAPLSQPARWEPWLTDPAARAKAGRSNRTAALERFSVQSMADGYEALYREVQPLRP